MSGTWEDLDRELHIEKANAERHGATFDCADAVTAVAHWINVPEPRRLYPDEVVMDNRTQERLAQGDLLTTLGIRCAELSGAINTVIALLEEGDSEGALEAAQRVQAPRRA